MRILIVEDEADLADALAEGLHRDGYHVAVAGDGATALQQLASADYDAIVLDRDLPVMSGDEVCRIVRAQGSDIPIIMLTAASSVEDRVQGLDLGADDYLIKPFAYAELTARLRALSRRFPERDLTYQVSDIVLNTERRTVERGGHPIGLTNKEYLVMETLMAAQGGFVTIDELLDQVWGSTEYTSRGVVKTTIYTLRRRLGFPDVLEGVTGRGYRTIQVEGR